jgi:OmpA-OmpF porin, OOP family
VYIGEEKGDEMKFRHYVFIGLCSMVAVPAMATESGWFVGMSLGRNNSNLTTDAPGIQSTNQEEHDAGYKLWGGYRFTPHFGAEVGFLDMGKYTNTGTGACVTTPCSANYSQQIKSRALQMVGTGALPLSSNIGVFGKLGATYSNTENNCVVGSFTCGSNSRSADLTYGLGLSYDLGKNLNIRSEWERMRLGDQSRLGDGGKIDFFTIGAGYRF